MNPMMKKIGLLVTACLLGTGIAEAATPLSVNLNESKYMESSHITRIAVGNPEIADVQLLSAKDFLLVGKKAGSTSLMVWTADGSRQEYHVYVSSEDQGTAQAIQKAIGYPGVQVQMIKDKILLRGKVENQYQHDMAVRMAQLYLGEANNTAAAGTVGGSSSGGTSLTTNAYAQSPSVLDMLEMEHPSQIRLEALIIEINSDDTKDLGIQYWSPTPGDDSSGDSGISVGTAGLFYGGEDFKTNRGSGGWLGSHIGNINATLQAMISSGKARILSRPSITTMSGQQASILIGGRIPVPVSDGNNNISIEWREYGVNLIIQPTVDNENRIMTNVHAEISTLDYGHAVKIGAYSVPALASREANAIVNVHSGNTMAIGGLLNSEDSKTLTKVPLLGDLPIIGQFFRHTSTTRDKRELMLLITPTLVSDDSPTPMTQKLKKSYELAQRQARNREGVNASYTPQGTEDEERDLWGDTPDNGDTIILEEKAPKKVPSYLLKTKGIHGEDLLIPMTQEDYERQKDNLQVAGTQSEPKTQKAKKAKKKVEKQKKDQEDDSDAEVIPVKVKKSIRPTAEEAEAQRARIKAAMDRYSGHARF